MCLDIITRDRLFVTIYYNNVTTLMMGATCFRLVLLAADTDPIDRIINFPAWCEEVDIPYCYVPEWCLFIRADPSECDNETYMAVFHECCGNVKRINRLNM